MSEVVSLNRLSLCGLVAVLVLLFCGCSGNTLKLATTTSTRDSGLLDELLPGFEQQSGVTVQVIAVGSGQALELGRRGDADLLLTHAPAAEQQFMEDGAGSSRHAIMYNDFIIAGPADDPAGIAGQKTVIDALQKIAAAKQPFASRADDSGTHMKEMALWKQAKLEPAGDWYLKAGAGMAAALRVAGEKNAYILCDRSTFLAHQDKLDLQIACQDDPLLHNPYSAIPVNAERHPHVNASAARDFVDYLLSSAVQDKISQFGKKKYGQPLFFVHEESGAR